MFCNTRNFFITFSIFGTGNGDRSAVEGDVAAGQGPLD